MDIVDFFPKNFHEIPEQDNPALSGEACFMIVGSVLGYDADVLRVGDDESCDLIGKFGKIENARDYAEYLSGKSNGYSMQPVR